MSEPSWKYRHSYAINLSVRFRKLQELGDKSLEIKKSARQVPGTSDASKTQSMLIGLRSVRIGATIALELDAGQARLCPLIGMAASYSVKGTMSSSGVLGAGSGGFGTCFKSISEATGSILRILRLSRYFLILLIVIFTQ